MLYKALLLLISILVKAEDRKDIISETERQTWRISDSELNNLVLFCRVTNSTKFPDQVYVRSPTNVSFLMDAYKRFEKQEVYRTLTVNYWRMPLYKKETVILKTEVLFNDKTVPDQYSVGRINQTVEERLSVTWDTDGELTINDRETNYFYSTKEQFKDVGDLSGVLNGYNIPDFSFTGPWGKNTTKTKTVTVGAEEVYTVEAKPGELVGVNLVATRGLVELHINYDAYLSGNILAYYRDKEAGYDHYYFHGVNDCLIKTGRRMIVNTNVVFKLEFYTDISVALTKSWEFTYFNATNQIIF